MLTSTAVVFDYLAKLGEVEVAGNKQAEAILQSFESARSTGNTKLSLQLEGATLADAATTFDL